MIYIITLNGKDYEVSVERGVADLLSVKNTADAPPAPAPVSPSRDTAAADGGLVASPMPGTVVVIHKAPGDKVKKGEVVLVLEAMKMENEITAIKDGTITQIQCAKGMTVNTGDPLFAVK